MSLVLRRPNFFTIPVIFQLVIYWHVGINDLDGWVEKSFLPFPKGWRRVVATQRHCNYGDHFRRRRGCVQTKTSEGGRIRTKADYYYFAPTGGRYQTVFRWTLPRRYSTGARGVAMARLTFRFVVQLRCSDYFAKNIYSYLVLQLACRKYCKNSLLIFLACDIINTYYKLEDILLCNIHMKLNLCNA